MPFFLVKLITIYTDKIIACICSCYVSRETYYLILLIDLLFIAIIINLYYFICNFVFIL